MIRNLSILDHPLVRDLLAYLRLLVKPSRQRRLRARAGGAGVGTRAGRPGAALRARREEPELRCGTRCNRRKASCRFSGAGRASTDELVAGITELRERAQPADRPRNCSTR